MSSDLSGRIKPLRIQPYEIIVRLKGNKMEKHKKSILFKGCPIRKAPLEGEWWFAVVGIVEVLTKGGGQFVPSLAFGFVTVGEG